MLSPGKITRKEFDEALGRYPALIKSISSAKTPAKDGQGQLTLEELDKFRFEVAPARYYEKDLEDPKAAPTPLSHADVVQLVKWKLKHGTFRPNLLKLAESNPTESIQSTTIEAFTTYKTDSFATKNAITTLTTLRGIGPATASLLLSIHDPARVPFFSDELFQWLVHDGKKGPIKYSPKEYEDLVASARKLIARLGGVDARDLEKVAFVLVREAGDNRPAPTATAQRNGTVATTTSVTTTSEAEAPAEKEKKSRNRKAGPKPPREPTDMTEERKSQLQEIAEKARAARVAKKLAKTAMGAKFRERVDAAREKKKDEPDTPATKAGAKRKSEVTTKVSTSASKRSRRSDV